MTISPVKSACRPCHLSRARLSRRGGLGDAAQVLQIPSEDFAITVSTGAACQRGDIDNPALAFAYTTCDLGGASRDAQLKPAQLPCDICRTLVASSASEWSTSLPLTGTEHCVPCTWQRKDLTNTCASATTHRRAVNCAISPDDIADRTIADGLPSAQACELCVHALCVAAIKVGLLLILVKDCSTQQAMQSDREENRFCWLR